jgi:ribokinase
VGLGSQGALLGLRKEGILTRFPAVKTRPVINTIGAGDALFSAFIHTYLETQDPILAIQKAILFASYKIGSIGAAEGFLTASELEQLLT